MLYALLATATWVPALWGLGMVLVPRELDEDLLPAAAGLLGLAALGLAGVAVNLVAPIPPVLAAAAGVAGWALFLLRGRALLRAAGAPSVVAMAAVLVGLCAFIQAPARQYDLGLYYLQAVKWVQESAQPIGIAHLHDRLAVNSSWFVASAALEHPLLVGSSAFVANTAAIWFGAWAAWAGLRRVASGDASPVALLLAGTAFVVAFCLRGIGAQGPDYPAAILVYLAIVAWISALSRPGAFEADATLALSLSAFALTVKLSSAPLAGAGAVIAALFVRRAGRARWLATPATAVAALGLIGWLARGIMASGCPMFPSPVGCLTALPWAAPALGEEMMRWIRAWARAPAMSPEVALDGWRWLPIWAEVAWNEGALPVVAVLVVAGALVLALARGRAPRPVLAGWAIAAGGSALWFASAPDPRFGFGFLAALALAPFAGAPQIRRAAASGAGRAALLAGLLAASVLVEYSYTAWWLDLTREEGATSWVEFPRFLRVPYMRRATVSGLRVNVPLSGDLCFAAPLPCAPRFDERLVWDGMFRRAAASPETP